MNVERGDMILPHGMVEPEGDMMKQAFWRSVALLAGMTLMCGCGGGSYSGVQAVAPAPQSQLVGMAQSSGEYTLYRAVGFAENYDEHIEPVWTVSLSAGQKVGFRWETESHKWDPVGPLHLIAFAGGESRDLGTFQKRDMSYVWAGSHGDVAGYFHSRDMQDTLAAVTLH
jgi:hypothetical protein